MFFKKIKKIFIIGLDGVPFSLLKEFCEDSQLKTLGNLFKEGDFVQMDSVHPTISSCAWTSFLTGLFPGNHGIYGFVDTKPFSYELYIPNYKDIREKTIYDYLNKDKIVSINIPITYPPFEINGILISGFLAPSIEKAVFPKEFYKKLKEENYIIDVDPWLMREGKEENFIEELKSAVRKRFLIANMLLGERATLFILHIMETDRIHHFFTDKKILKEFYKFLDNEIGKFLKLLSDNDILILLSDHGFTEIKKEVNINAVLRNNGFLQFEKQEPEGIRDIKEETHFYSMTPGRIYGNIKGEKPKAKYSYEQIKEKIPELNEILYQLVDEEQGKKVIKEIKEKEEIFGNAPKPYAPLLLAISEKGYDLKADIKNTNIFEKGILKGMHTYDDAFLFIRGKKILKRPCIVDVLPTIFKLKGIDFRNFLDGSPVI